MTRLIIVIMGLFLFSCVYEDPNFITIEVHDDTNRIIVDDSYSDIPSIEALVYIKTQYLDSTQKTEFYVKLNYSDKTSKGIISDIENVLRNANVKNVKYVKIKPVTNKFLK